MTVGITLPLGPNDVRQSGNAVDMLVDYAREAASLGVRGVWISQMFDIDALTAVSAIAREVPQIALGTAAVPICPRHPIVLANQAQTVQAASAAA
nr:LLM class flavin-dependent oxidoreductase [Fodinicola acaciae]